MSTSVGRAFVRWKSSLRRIKWTRHALNELALEPLSVADVEVALGHGEVIEKYSRQDRYLPDCLVLALTASGEPVHCVIAIGEVQG